MEELREAVEATVEQIMLDNWDTVSMRDAVAFVAAGAAGGVGQHDGGARPGVAATGVDLISVGALHHSARALDMSLLQEGVGA